MRGGLVWKRVALAFSGLAVGLVLTEAGLHVAAWAAQRAVGQSLPRAWLTNDFRVLCLGDSNTYGLNLSREQAYPRRLEALWAAEVETQSLEVLNLGVPGTNSSRLVRDLQDLLDALSPELVLFMVGVNDAWTAPCEIEEGSESLAHFTKRHSKLYKLFRLVRRGNGSSVVEMIRDPAGRLDRGAAHRLRMGEHQFDAGWSKARPGDARDRATLSANLERLVGETRRGGARPALLTYASRVGFYASANRMTRRAAAATRATLVDVAEAFAARCKDVSCRELLFDDQHPREAGHELIARTLLDALPPVLK